MACLVLLLVVPRRHGGRVMKAGRYAEAGSRRDRTSGGLVVPLPADLGQQCRHHCPCRLCNVGMFRVLVSMRDSEVVVEVQQTILLLLFFLWRRLPSSFAPRRPSLPLNSQKQNNRPYLDLDASFGFGWSKNALVFYSFASLPHQPLHRASSNRLPIACIACTSQGKIFLTAACLWFPAAHSLVSRQGTSTRCLLDLLLAACLVFFHVANPSNGSLPSVLLLPASG